MDILIDQLGRLPGDPGDIVDIVRPDRNVLCQAVPLDIIGVIALGILPNLSEPGKEFENKEELVKKGNMTGLWISGLTVGFLMIIGAIAGANK